MKYIITENKLEQVILHFLNKGYGDLTEYRSDEYPDSILYVRDKKVYMYHDIETGILWVDYGTIWKDLENWFSMDDNDIEYVIKKWVEVAYNLRDVRPWKRTRTFRLQVEVAYNIKNRL